MDFFHRRWERNATTCAVVKSQSGVDENPQKLCGTIKYYQFQLGVLFFHFFFHSVVTATVGTNLAWHLYEGYDSWSEISCIAINYRIFAYFSFVFAYFDDVKFYWLIYHHNSISLKFSDSLKSVFHLIFFLFLEKYDAQLMITYTG